MLTHFEEDIFLLQDKVTLVYLLVHSVLTLQHLLGIM
jgi:hypothetical protein